MPHRSTPRPLRAAALALLLAAAPGQAQEAPAFTVRDSAGYHIAQSTRPAWPEGEGWLVGPTPRWETAYTGDPVLLPDGRLATHDYRRYVRLYGPDHVLLDSLRAPRREETIEWFGAGAGDSLLAWTDAGRLLVLDRDGRLRRQARVGGLRGPHPTLVGRLADGTLLVTEGDARPTDSAVPLRAPIRHVLVGPDGRPRADFAALPEVARVRGGMEVPFSPRFVVATRGGDVLAGDNARFEFGVYTPDGRLRTLVRRAWTPMEVRDADVARWHDDRAIPLHKVSPESRVQVLSMMAAHRAVPAAETFPAYTRLLTDPAGSVWAEESRRPSDPVPTWSVFDAEGRWLARVRMPAGFALYQVGPDWVLGTEPGAAGGYVTRLYPLTRPAGEAPPAP